VAFRIFAAVPRIILDQHVNEVISVFERGLSAENESEKLWALKGSVAFLTATDRQSRERATGLMTAMLNVRTFAISFRGTNERLDFTFAANCEP
jgi:hypothetical protein